MDQIISRAMIFDRGAAGFDRGVGINDHGMNPGASAIPVWQDGWRARQVEASREFAAMLGGTPP